MHFAGHARKVTLIVRSDSLEKGMSRYLTEQIRGISSTDVRLRSKVRAAYGEALLDAIDIHDREGRTVCRYDRGGSFVFIGADADTEWRPPEIARDVRGYVLTGEDLVGAGRWSHARNPLLLEASTPGVFACGDVRLSPIKRGASAVGEGSMAIEFVHQYLQQDGRHSRS